VQGNSSSSASNNNYATTSGLQVAGNVSTAVSTVTPASAISATGSISGQYGTSTSITNYGYAQTANSGGASGGSSAHGSTGKSGHGHH
jgi:hypothetical protein